jgi:hypothetical protein
MRSDADRAQYCRHFRSDRGSIAAKRDQDQAEVAIMNSKCSWQMMSLAEKLVSRSIKQGDAHECKQDKDRAHRDDFAE